MTPILHPWISHCLERSDLLLQRPHGATEADQCQHAGSEVLPVHPGGARRPGGEGLPAAVPGLHAGHGVTTTPRLTEVF